MWTWAAACGAFTSTGVLDRCLEEGVRFDAGVGVSAEAPTSPLTWPGKRVGTTSFMRSIPAARSTWAWHSVMGKRGVWIRCCLYTCSPSSSDSRSKFCT